MLAAIWRVRRLWIAASIRRLTVLGILGVELSIARIIVRTLRIAASSIVHLVRLILLLSSTSMLLPIGTARLFSRSSITFSCVRPMTMTQLIPNLRPRSFMICPRRWTARSAYSSRGRRAAGVLA